MTQRFLTSLTAAALLALAAVPAAAGDHKKPKGHEAARAALARGEIQPLTKILAAAQARAPGDVIKIELEDEKGRLIYEVKILGRDGRVREIELDARTAAVLKVEDD
ncbi:PepSY domain-containing protein [Phenylobacterium sp.]|uniref:PepSY domain-containing protein n=1 Tax=Phenylobacterium sp. TaxID=1871053 RepID=UPI0025DF673A|nr:PepSY domain-containing protein [Phenylobacterium sp.]MBX3484098.1 PepSY domain-containing protein [Phenylobacterium sp.]